MKLALLSAFLMLLGIAGILLSTLLYVHDSSDYERIDYAVFLDAGSSGTRAYIYQWDHKTTNTLPWVSIPTDDNDKPYIKKIEPGITSLGDPRSVGAYLTPLLDWAEDTIEDLPYASVSSTPIYLMGTGGMRQLSETDQAGIITQVRFTFQDSGFLFQPSYATVVPGEEEAAFGFMSVNALFNTFDEDNSDPQDAFGSLDLGGVSSGISFITSGAPPTNYSFPVTINGTYYPIYAQNFDGIGINAARYTYNLSLYENSNVNFLVVDPCLPLGYEEYNVTIQVNGAWHYFSMVGSSDADQCADDVSKLVQTLTSGYPKPPDFSSIQFVAQDKYIQVKDFFKLDDHATIVDLRAKVGHFCALNYSDALALRPKYADTTQYYCFMGNYIVSLLTDFYGFNPTVRHISWEENINEYPVSWTLGAMLDTVGAMAPDTAPYSGIHNHVRFYHTDGGVVVLFASILVFILGFVVYVLQRKRPTSQYTAIAD